MPQTLILRNGTLVMPTGLQKADLKVEDGKIVEIGQVSEKSGSETEYDCTGLFVLPGLIDMHVHLRDPGAPEKEDFMSGTMAAAAGGVTTVIDMPNTRPPTTTLAALHEKREIAAAKAVVNYGFYMGFTGLTDNLEEIKKAKNIAGVKVYMASSTGDLLLKNTHAMEKLFELGKFVIVHAEDEKIIQEHQEKYRNDADPSVHSLIRSSDAAFKGVMEALHCAKKTNGRVHITHVTSQLEVEEIAKFKGPSVSADCTPHHLFLNETAYAAHGNFVKVNPPLRSEASRVALWKALKEGTIQAIATDHAPHTKKEKLLPYPEAPSGVPGLETMLPLLLDAVNHGDINLEDVAHFTGANPAHILQIKNKGKIEVGYDADFAIVDMNKEEKVGALGYMTKAHWSPFQGRTLKGWPIATIVGGNIIYKNGECSTSYRGKEVTFDHS